MPTSSNVIAHVYADLAESTVTPKRVTCVQYDADTKMWLSTCWKMAKSGKSRPDTPPMCG